MSLTFGSLFAGIGGMDLGLERAGMTCRWHVEIDPYCRRVLAKHWPDVPRLEDVREVGAHNLGPVDLIAGGFPCQDISNAGKRAGIDGERSGLWSEYARIIRELRPRYVLVENVSALLARGVGRVLGDLAACGYDAEWDCIPAAAVGAPHRRDRLFLVAYADTPRLQERVYVVGPGRAAIQGKPSRRAAVGVPATPMPSHAERGERPLGRSAGRAGRQRERVQGDGDWPLTAEPVLGRGGDGVPSRLDRLRGLGNAVVPQVAEYIGRLIAAHAADESEAA
jgi:DNA (cytosine-5)-methyltransferase 1